MPPPHPANAPLPSHLHIPGCALHPSSLPPPPGAYPRHINNHQQQQHLANRQQHNLHSGMFTVQCTLKVINRAILFSYVIYALKAAE